MALLATTLGAGAAVALEWNYDQYPDDLDPGLEYLRLAITTHDSVKIAAWFIPAQDSAGATRPDRNPGILILPREGQTMEARLDLISGLARRGFNVLLFDHRGQGASEPFAADPAVLVPTEYLVDAESALDILWSRSPVDTTRVAVYGESMGGVEALAVAGRRPEARAVVAVSVPYNWKKYGEVLQGWEPPGRLVIPEGWKRKDEPDKVVKRYNGAILFIVGDQDADTPVWMAEDLHKRYAREKEIWVVQGAGHTPPTDPRSVLGETFDERVAGFLTRELAREPHPGWPRR